MMMLRAAALGTAWCFLGACVVCYGAAGGLSAFVGALQCLLPGVLALAFGAHNDGAAAPLPPVVRAWPVGRVLGALYPQPHQRARRQVRDVPFLLAAGAALLGALALLPTRAERLHLVTGTLWSAAGAKAFHAATRGTRSAYAGGWSATGTVLVGALFPQLRSFAGVSMLVLGRLACLQEGCCYGLETGPCSGRACAAWLPGRHAVVPGSKAWGEGVRGPTLPIAFWELQASCLGLASLAVTWAPSAGGRGGGAGDDPRTLDGVVPLCWSYYLVVRCLFYNLRHAKAQDPWSKLVTAGCLLWSLGGAGAAPAAAHMPVALGALTCAGACIGLWNTCGALQALLGGTGAEARCGSGKPQALSTARPGAATKQWVHVMSMCHACSQARMA